VHLQDWPDKASFAADEALVKRMDLARAVCSAAASVRTAQNLRNRLPLSTLTVAHAGHTVLEPLREVIAEEANVKQVVFAEDPTAFGAEVLAVNSRIVGKRVGGKMKDVLAAAKAGNWHRVGGGAVEVAGEVLQPAEFELRFQAKEGLSATPFDGAAGVVVLDTKVTPALEREGLARDFIRLVQVARKEADFKITDRIAINVKAGPAASEAIRAHLGEVKAETLATSLDFADAPAGTVSETKLGDETVTIGIKVA
jgi:isoleucyl-tRNA synthetase